jgi:hypothetical protein
MMLRRLLVMGMVLGLALVACGGLSSGSSSPAAGRKCADLALITGSLSDHGTAPIPSPPALQANDVYFSPSCLTGASGSVTLQITNRGRLLHNFSVTEQNIDVDLPAGQTVAVPVKVGTKPVQFFCKYHRDSGQQGALIPAR